MNPKRYILFVLCIILSLILYSTVYSAAPIVKNVRDQQRPGTRLVDITYDVSDPDGDLLTITVVASNDNGITYTIIPKSLTGDVGKGIRSGNGKKIVWDVGKDLPKTKGTNFKVRVLADDSIIIIGKDGAEMVLIPAGEFQMGSNEYDNEKPIHTVYLDAFYIDKYEVTNAQYRKFVQATGRKEPEGDIYTPNGWVWGKPWQDKNYNGDNQPVVCVTWEDGNAYAKWAGKRLPTEAEWEKAARGGVAGKKYIWGDGWPPPKNAGNFADISAKKVFPDWLIIEGYDDGYAYPAPVGKFTPNGYGLCDMAGNVWEWCADWYSGSYYSTSPKQNPKGPGSGDTRVFRGGSWYYNDTYSLRVAVRYYGYPASTHYAVGFRCSGL